MCFVIFGASKSGDLNSKSNFAQRIHRVAPNCSVVRSITAQDALLAINTFMEQFRATVKANGIWAITIVLINNPILAFKLAQSQYDASNVLAPPAQLEH
jgi:hypothetical protein